MNRKIVATIKNRPLGDKDEIIYIVMPEFQDIEENRVYIQEEHNSLYMDLHSFLRGLEASRMKYILMLFGSVETQNDVILRLMDSREDMVRINPEKLYQQLMTEGTNEEKKLVSLYGQCGFSMENAIDVFQSETGKDDVKKEDGARQFLEVKEEPGMNQTLSFYYNYVTMEVLTEEFA